jgi:hypothetical protein
MPNNRNPNEKQPGEKQPGKFHYNPGNMSGKNIGAREEDAQAQVKDDGKQGETRKQDQERT